MPDPGDELIARVAGGTDRASFYASGRQSVHELERTLATVERSLDSFDSILDFGCGCGRMLLWMGNLAASCALHGTDIDPEAVAWCQANLPYARVSANHADPPLPYPDGAFDLVFNHSVFSHLDEQRQDRWLGELQRVTRVGGFLVLSVHGEVALPQGAWQIRDRLERDGIAFLAESLPTEFPLPDWYQNTWHAPWYVFEHWSKWFEVGAYLPGAALGLQDHVLLERREDAVKPRPLAARPPVPAPQAPSDRTAHALAEVRRYRSGSNGARGWLRRLVLRLIRPYTAHADKFDEAVTTSIAELTRASDQHEARLRELEHRERQQ
jgi:SAM-dependent methyltransferase